MRTAEYPRPDHFLLHISDTHLLAGGGRLYDRVASEHHLRTLFEEFEASGARPEAIVFTGDLADQGEPDAYDRIRRIVDPVADRLGAQVDLGHGQPRRPRRRSAAACSATRSAADRPVDRVDDVNGLRVITLDSTVPGHHHGEVAPDQLDWLAEELAIPAPHGTILAMHHPPVPSVLDLAVSVELRDQAGLAEVVEGSDIRSIIAGHLHYSSTATFAGVPVSVASASCYTQDLNVPVGGTRGRDGAPRVQPRARVPDAPSLHSVVPLGVVPGARLDRRRRERAPARRLGHRHRGCRVAAGAEEPPFTADPGARLRRLGSRATAQAVRSGWRRLADGRPGIRRLLPRRRNGK